MNAAVNMQKCLNLESNISRDLYPENPHPHLPLPPWIYASQTPERQGPVIPSTLLKNTSFPNSLTTSPLWTPVPAPPLTVIFPELGLDPVLPVPPGKTGKSSENNKYYTSEHDGSDTLTSCLSALTLSPVENAFISPNNHSLFSTSIQKVFRL